MVDDLWYYKLREREKNLIQHLYTPLGQKFYSRFFTKNVRKIRKIPQCAKLPF